MPPSLVLVGSLDPEVPLPTVQAYCEAVTSAGADCDIALYAGESHGFFNKPRFRDMTNQRILGFLTGSRHMGS